MDEPVVKEKEEIAEAYDEEAFIQKWKDTKVFVIEDKEYKGEEVTYSSFTILDRESLYAYHITHDYLYGTSTETLYHRGEGTRYLYEYLGEGEVEASVNEFTIDYGNDYSPHKSQYQDLENYFIDSIWRYSYYLPTSYMKEGNQGKIEWKESKEEYLLSYTQGKGNDLLSYEITLTKDFLCKKGISNRGKDYRYEIECSYDGSYEKIGELTLLPSSISE